MYYGLQQEAEKVFEPNFKIELLSLDQLDLQSPETRRFTITKISTQETMEDGSFATVKMLKSLLPLV